MKSTLTVERLRGLLDYSQETGVFTWRESRGKAKAGAVAGCREHRGYIVISIDGVRYYAHRLAVLHMTGRWPAAFVDHRSGNKGDNRAAELRDVAHAVNQQNQRTASANNKLGVLGVRKFGKRFRSAICVGGAAKHLGTFDTPELAYDAYIAAKRRLHEGCTI